MIMVYNLFFWVHFPPLVFLALFGLLINWLASLANHYDLSVYGIRIALSADQLANTFAAGFPDETLSARVGRAMASGKPKTIAKILNPFINAVSFDPDHTKNAIEHDEKFNQRYEPWPWSYWSERELYEKRKMGR